MSLVPTMRACMADPIGNELGARMPASGGAPAGGLSPSLVPRRERGGAPAYEIKYVVDEAVAGEIERRLGAFMRPDAFCDAALGGAYGIASVYCDTPEFGVYFREGRHGFRKYRVRKYGADGPVFVERKSSRNRRVRKRRTRVEEAALASGEPLLVGAAESAWFASQVSAARLRPVCRLRYQRRALMGEWGGGPVRVTFDRGIRGALAEGWGFGIRGGEVELLAGVVVCEFKFAGAMPGELKAVAAELRLDPCGVSKYRACVSAFASALGVVRPVEGEGPARSGGPHA